MLPLIASLAILAAWALFFTLSYTLSAFNAKYDPMWYLPGVLVAMGILIPWARTRRPWVVYGSLGLAGLASLWLPSSYLIKEGYQAEGIGVPQRRLMWQKTVAATAVVIVSSGMIISWKRKAETVQVRSSHGP
jgi:hypothetical protein